MAAGTKIELPSIDDVTAQINAEPQDTDDRPKDGRTRSGTVRRLVERSVVEQVYEAIKVTEEAKGNTVLWGNTPTTT